MKTSLFGKAQERHLINAVAGFLHVETVTSFNGTSDDVLYKLSSDILTVAQIKARYDSKLTFITPAEAKTLYETLNPDRNIDDVPHTFEFPFTEDELDNQVQQEISDLKERKAFRIFMQLTLRTLFKKTSIAAPTAEEEAFMLSYMTDVLSKYSDFLTAKSDLSFSSTDQTASTEDYSHITSLE